MFLQNPTKTERDSVCCSPLYGLPLIFSFSKALHAYVLQVIILANHMNGKDTHVRGLRVLGPNEYVLWAHHPFR